MSLSSAQSSTLCLTQSHGTEIDTMVLRQTDAVQKKKMDIMHVLIKSAVGILRPYRWHIGPLGHGRLVLWLTKGQL